MRVWFWEGGGSIGRRKVAGEIKKAIRLGFGEKLGLKVTSIFECAELSFGSGLCRCLCHMAGESALMSLGEYEDV